MQGISMMDEKESTLYMAHDNPASGHPGVKRTIDQLVRASHAWEEMEEDME